MNQKYVMALVDDDAFCIRADGMNVASFIKEYGELEDIAIMTMHRYPLLNTRGGFVDRCFDQEYLAKQLLPCLIPIQQEQIPPAEIDYLKSWDLLPENAAPVPDWDCDKDMESGTLISQNQTMSGVRQRNGPRKKIWRMKG